MSVQELDVPVSGMSDASLGDSGQLGSFHVFPNLPTEMQLKIWEEAIPKESRIIVIKVSATKTVYDEKCMKAEMISAQGRWNEGCFYDRELQMAINNLQLWSPNAPSVLFGICQTSRSAILGQLKACVPLSHGGKVYFNNERDIIVINSGTSLPGRQFPTLPGFPTLPQLNPRYPDIFKNVKKLALEPSNFKLGLMDISMCSWFLQQFPSLEELSLMIYESNRSIAEMAKSPESLFAFEDITAKRQAKGIPHPSKLQDALENYRKHFDRPELIKVKYVRFHDGNPTAASPPDVVRGLRHIMDFLRSAGLLGNGIR
ncbi:hypothetical protein EG329_006649 [Mollisiaceae sp. DMI_Dod_QoI]|nr:hypothetical protein EG329_006649 [Helotiales sp. DMI_Dod_QoI]